LDDYILVRGADEASVRGAFEGIEGFWTFRVGRVSSTRTWPEGPAVFAVGRVSTLSSPDLVLARLDEVAEEARAIGRPVEFEMLLAGEQVWDSEVLTLPGAGLLREDVVVAVLEIAPALRMPDGRALAELMPEAALEARRAAKASAGADAELAEPDEAPPAPDWDEAFLWDDGGAEWVAVDMAWGWQMEVEIRLAKLLDARIPATLDTRPFAEHQAWFFGALFMSKILVPPSRADEARELLAAGFDDEEAEFAEAAEDELNELYYQRPFYQFTHSALWVYIVYYVAMGYLGPAIAWLWY
jgi:hypothetical protein